MVTVPALVVTVRLKAVNAVDDEFVWRAIQKPVPVSGFFKRVTKAAGFVT